MRQRMGMTLAKERGNAYFCGRSRFSRNIQGWAAGHAVSADGIHALRRAGSFPALPVERSAV